MESICKKCIHNCGNVCEAFRDEYLQINDKGECEDFDDGTCHTISAESTCGEDDFSKEWG